MSFLLIQGGGKLRPNVNGREKYDVSGLTDPSNQIWRTFVSKCEDHIFEPSEEARRRGVVPVAEAAGFEPDQDGFVLYKRTFATLKWMKKEKKDDKKEDNKKKPAAKDAGNDVEMTERR